MIEFGNSVFYIDLKALDRAITINKGNNNVVIDKETKNIFDGQGNLISTETFERIGQQNKEIDATKYDMLKTFIDFIMDDVDVSDDTLGSDRALEQANFSYKLIFNTLLNEGIIKEKE
jgi:hypothetical protein